MRRRVVLPLQEWRELSSRSRREVRRAARHGRPHPDGYVSQLAYAWAVETLRIQAGRDRGERAAEGIFGGALLAVLGSLVPDAVLSAGSGSVADWRERRLARRLVGIEPFG